MKTPTGLLGLSSLARAVWMRLAIIRPCVANHASTRVSASLRMSAFVADHLAPGMPVQSCTTPPRPGRRPVGSTSGVSACRRRRVLGFAELAAQVRVRRHFGSPPLAGWRAARGCVRPAFSSSQRWVRRGDLAPRPRRASSRHGQALAMAVTHLFFTLQHRQLGGDHLQAALAVSSRAAGVACWLTATRAQAVSSRLMALSGSWRAGCSGATGARPNRPRWPGSARGGASPARARRRAASGCRARPARRPAPPGSGGSGRVLLEVLLYSAQVVARDGAQLAAGQGRFEQVGASPVPPAAGANQCGLRR